MYPHPESNKKTSLQPSKQTATASKAATANRAATVRERFVEAQNGRSFTDITAQVLILHNIGELSPHVSRSILMDFFFRSGPSNENLLEQPSP